MVGGVDGCEKAFFASWARSNPDLRPRSSPWPPGPHPPANGIDWSGGLHRPLFPAASSAVLGAVAKDPAAFLPTLAAVWVCPHQSPPSRLLSPFPVIPHRAEPSYATGLQPPSPEKPSAAAALLALFAFFFSDCHRTSGTRTPSSNHSSRSPDLSTIPSVLGPGSDVRSEHSSPSAFRFGLPQTDCLLNILRRFKMVSWKSPRPSWKRKKEEVNTLLCKEEESSI